MPTGLVPWYFLRYAIRITTKNLLQESCSIAGAKTRCRLLLGVAKAVGWIGTTVNGTCGFAFIVFPFLNIFYTTLSGVAFEPYPNAHSRNDLAKGGEKMSKSKGNVVNPDEMVEQFGADALRTYIMFMGPFDQAVEWDTNGVVGVKRFLDRVWLLQEKVMSVIASTPRGINSAKQSLGDGIVPIVNRGSATAVGTALPLAPRNDKLETLLHQTIQKVGEDIEAMRFNTAIAKMMELVNEMSKVGVENFQPLQRGQYELLIKILSPFAPHMCEEL